MEIVETLVFTKRIKAVLSDDEYSELQQALVINPEAGALIPGGGGLRKLRWAVPGKGKSGGLRIIYYWYASNDRIYMLFVYKKTEQEDLTNKQLAKLKEYVKGGLL
jgi:hypothetical protein